ncbi:DUF4168 domain-containing protein [Leptolyngbya sp. FACHB-321]|uniref:DUF4168 domain-containing protein n=1 Tax=Leptolyngbya sp. FACHB-321 TaxID=2692807 RepID=UPI001687F8F0|nr:DUF4168 domain-containing protein [Leptolyngbya sp. FACHB-321]MBD2037958.1 DUF4168 domain-containing protein [Leptolyngbya sp. FACHB-321]
MMRHILAGCSLLVAVAVSSLPAQAQNTPAPAAKPAPAAQPAPATQPAPGAKPAPATQTAPAATPAPTKPATAQEKVSPEELKKFASATKQLLAIVNDTESQMVQAVEKQGLSQTRFNEIYQSKQNPNAKPATQITSKEEASYKQAVTQLTQLQKDAQTKMDQVVQAQGLPMERFNQIFAAVQKDPQLKQEVRKMIQN